MPNFTLVYIYVIHSHLYQYILYSAGKVFMQEPRQAKRAKSTHAPHKPSLWEAVEKGDEDSVHDLLTSGSPVDETYKGWTPLMKAAEENHTIIALQLLAHGADLEAVNNTGRTALSFAAAPSGDRPVARETLAFLMAWGANDGHRNHKSRTALEQARKENRTEAIGIFKYFQMLVT